MSVRTPDPNPGWLSDEDLYEARRRLPMVYVEAIPVRLDSLGYVTEIGLLYVADETGTFQRTFVSGRVQYRETIRAALMRRSEELIEAWPSYHQQTVRRASARNRESSERGVKGVELARPVQRVHRDRDAVRLPLPGVDGRGDDVAIGEPIPLLQPFDHLDRVVD